MTHINDLIRADIAKRNWAAMHIRSDKSQPIHLPDRLVRTRDGQAIQLRPWFGAIL